MPAYVRKSTLQQRLRSQLDLSEVLLFLSEQFDDYRDVLEQPIVTIPTAAILNSIFILLRLTATQHDDVFDQGRHRLYNFLHTVVQYSILALCLANAAYTVFQTRTYTLMHQPLDEKPSSSARIVRLGDAEVWQINAWSPSKFNLSLLTFFSPVQLALYYTVLPVSPSPRIMALLVSLLGFAAAGQFALVARLFDQQARDNTVIHGQVLKEYDEGFVQPLMHRSVRDVGIQTGAGWTVDAYSPGVQVNRGTGHINYTPTSYARSGSRPGGRFSGANGVSPSVAAFKRTSAVHSRTKDSGSGVDQISPPSRTRRSVR